MSVPAASSLQAVEKEGHNHFSALVSATAYFLDRIQQQEAGLSIRLDGGQT